MASICEVGHSAVAADLGAWQLGSRLGGQGGDRSIGEDEVRMGGEQGLLDHAERGEVAAVPGDDEEPVESGIGELAHDRGDEIDEQLRADVDRAGQEAVMRGETVVDARQDEGSGRPNLIAVGAVAGVRLRPSSAHPLRWSTSSPSSVRRHAHAHRHGRRR